MSQSRTIAVGALGALAGVMFMGYATRPPVSIEYYTERPVRTAAQIAAAAESRLVRFERHTCQIRKDLYLEQYDFSALPAARKRCESLLQRESERLADLAVSDKQHFAEWREANRK